MSISSCSFVYAHSRLSLLPDCADPALNPKMRSEKPMHPFKNKKHSNKHLNPKFLDPSRPMPDTFQLHAAEVRGRLDSPQGQQCLRHVGCFGLVQALGRLVFGNQVRVSEKAVPILLFSVFLYSIYIYTYIHTYIIYIYIHTYIHIYIYIHIRVYTLGTHIRSIWTKAP